MIFSSCLDESEEGEEEDDEEKRSHPYICRPSNGYVPILFVSHAETCHRQSEREDQGHSCHAETTCTIHPLLLENHHRSP